MFVRNGATPSFRVTEMERLRVLGLQKWSDSGFLAYKKWSDSGFLACEKWSDSGFLACNYYEEFSVFLYFLPDFWFIQKTIYIRLVSESPFTTYVKTVLNDRIPLIFNKKIDFEVTTMKVCNLLLIYLMSLFQPCWKFWQHYQIVTRQPLLDE